MKHLTTGIGIVILILFSGCKKETSQRCNWTLVDQLGNLLNTIDDMSEEEFLNCTTCGTFGNYPPGTPLNQMLSPCNYFSSCDPAFCWVAGGVYFHNVPERYINCHHTSTVNTKVLCNSCGNWYTRKKITFIPTNSTQYTNPAPLRAYCGDTATQFKTGQPFIIKNTSDSLILLQYSIDYSVWN